MYELDYVIGSHLTSARNSLVKEFNTYLINTTSLNLTQRRKLLAKNALSCFLLNSYRSYSRSMDRVYLTLDERNYSNETIVNGRYTDRKVSYTYTRHLLSFLYQYEYIDLYIGGVKGFSYDPKNSKIKPETKESSYATLLEPLNDLFSTVITDKEQIKTNVLFLKDKQKNFITFRLNEELRSKRDYLQAYNKFTCQFKVTKDEEVFDVQMYKIYNTGIGKGGRSFMNGSIQALSAEERKELLISGKPTTGYDYVSFEPSLAYSVSQEVMEGDAYDIKLDGYAKSILRDLAKHTLMMMFNCKDRKGAKQALNSYIKKNYDTKELNEQDLIPNDWIHTDCIMDRLEAKHHRIHNFFYNDSSYGLQQVGSLINDYVVDTLMQKHGVLALQVHDSFIVQEEHGGLLKDTMIRAYDHLFGYSDNCYIKLEF